MVPAPRIIQQRLVELAQVDLEIEPIGRLLDQQALHVVAGEPHEIRLRQHLLDAGDELGPRLVARAHVELEQIGRVAVGAERKIVLDQVEQAPAMLLMPPGGEAIERATPSLPVAAALGEHGDELGSEPIAADRDEPLAGVRLGRRGLGRLACPGCGRGRRRGIEQLHGAKLRRARRSQANAVSSLRRAGSARARPRRLLAEADARRVFLLAGRAGRRAANGREFSLRDAEPVGTAPA